MYVHTYLCTFSSPYSKPSCVTMQNTTAICSKYILQDTEIYVPGNKSIAELEKSTESSISQLGIEESNCYQQMVKIICYSYLAPCYLEAPTPTPMHVCPQSCVAALQCDGEMFRRVQTQLPEWSLARNCSSLQQDTAGFLIPKCIHLSRGNNNHSDSKCIMKSNTFINM